ncbi:putative membrane protein YdfJ with MMPL/SSD domain [Streptomyces phaeochromogenes]|uniref:MMPL family transporter n=1 Tax=Streptomyces phaeochromogenes TaxID=1923 RepID=UPI00278CC9E9|nr:MMPL family transporter [Streptomyces phaeochromogenes]MDQ0954685.1 putative membrane protein YdfJ with MMPL/SSD domain [Streptomyces phaeochromogenes]
MASRLYTWGQWAVRRRGRVIAVWLLLLAVVGGLGVTLHGKVSNEFSVPGIESQKAQDLLEEKFPTAAGGVARVVFAAPEDGTLTEPKAESAVAASLRKAADVPGVVNVSDPAGSGTVSENRRIGYADVLFRQSADEVPETSKDALSEAMAQARDAGLEVEFGGSAMQPKTEVGGPAEIVGVMIAFAVLALALGSLVAAGLPLLTAVVGVAIGVLGVQFVSSFVEMTSTATVLALMIGLAVGIDYALFILSRHREQLADPDTDVEDSIARAVATAGSAVVFAGATVIIALAALAVTGIPFLTIMGLAAAVTVLLAVLIAITLVPAVLGLFGERLRPRARRTERTERTKRTPGSWGLAWARVVTRKPLIVLLVGVIGMLALALPARDLRLGLPSYASQPADSTQHKSYDLLSEGFGPGFNATLTAVVDTGGIPAAERTATVADLRTTLAREPGVAAVAPPVTNPDSTLAVVAVVPRTGPDAQATTDLVHRLRDNAPGIAQAGGTLYIAGATAAAIDVAGKLSDALPLFIAIIVILALILLTVAFRSLLVPVKAALGFLLSVAAALGATVWVFQNGHLNGVLDIPSAGPVTSFLPVLLIGVLFGLAMDYEVFLVSRMREHYEHTGSASEAITHGVARSGRVVSAAALIMVAVFGGFVFNHDPIIKSIGFALAFGVFIDAFVVRMTLVPAAMALLGRRAWGLPGWLDRITPDVDIEGAKLPQRATARRDVEDPEDREGGADGEHREEREVAVR